MAISVLLPLLQANCINPIRPTTGKAFDGLIPVDLAFAQLAHKPSSTPLFFNPLPLSSNRPLTLLLLLTLLTLLPLLLLVAVFEPRDLTLQRHILCLQSGNL